MPRINVIIDDNTYLRLIKVKTQLSKETPLKNINLTDAVKHVLKKGLEN